MLSLFILVSVASAASSYISKVDNAYVYVYILNRCVPTVYDGAQLYARTTIDEDGETYATKYYFDDGCRILYDEDSASLEGAQVGELPATVAYKLYSSEENCEKDDLAMVEGYRTGCNPYTSGETTYYVKSTVSSGQLTVQAYTDEECNSPIQENDLISYQYDCDTCIEEEGSYFTVYCKALKDSVFGTGSTKDPEEVDANTIQEIESKYKYMVIPQEGMNIYYETDKCLEVEGERSMYIINPSSDFVIMCIYEGSATCEAPEGTEPSSICNLMSIGESGVKAYNKFPKNIAYMEMSIDETCNDLVEGVGIIFPEGCQQLIEQDNPYVPPQLLGSVQFVIEEGTLKGTKYTDGVCTTPDAEVTPVEFECDSCVNMEFKGKLHCEPLSGGAFNTFLLLALVLIAFIF